MASLHLRAAEFIEAPLHAVWERASDTSRYAEWIAGTLQVTRTDGPARLGSTYDEINAIVGPLRGSSHWTVRLLGRSLAGANRRNAARIRELVEREAQAPR